MPDRSLDVVVHSQSRQDREAQLRGAYVRLAKTLQSLDLEDEAQLADSVIEAVQATDQALEVADEYSHESH